MIKTIITLLIIIPAILFGQQTKKVKQKHKNPSTIETYYVLKSDKSIRHGSYKKLWDKDHLLIDGYYKNGLKDSVWSFYDYKGEIEQKYDFTKKEVVYFKLNDKEKENEFRVIKGADTTKMKLNQPPLYIGGSRVMFETFIRKIIYPQQAKENGVSGKVYITFTIANNGKTSNHRVTKGVGSGCDEEALSVVKGIPDNWVPGLLNGQAVSVEYIIPIYFKLQ